MAQSEFLRGEITERFLADAGGGSLQNEGEQVVFLTPVATVLLTVAIYVGVSTCFL